MILSVFRYSSVTAKVRAMMGRMLDTQDYEELISKKSVQDVASYLKHHKSYRHMLEEVNDSTIHRAQLEKILKRSLFHDYFKLLKFTKGNVRVFLKLALLRYEIENLKILLRVLNYEHNVHIALDSLNFLAKYDTVNIERLVASKNVREFIQNLKGSVYYDILFPFLENSQQLNLFSIEMSLDLHFLSLIWKQKDKLLSGENKKIVTVSLGSEIDILNMLWVYRCKKYYTMPKEIIYSYLIPYRYGISRDHLISMVEAGTVEELESLISQTKYASIFEIGNRHFFEENFTYFSYKLHKKNIRENYFSISPILAYLHLKDIEIQNIISIIEGVRYSLDAEEIKRYVVGI